MIIDTHTHFYDPTRPQGVPWPRTDSSLYRTVLPEHFRSAAKPCGVTGTIVIESSPWVEDNQWLLELARNEPTIHGIVGRLDPGDPQYREHLARFADDPLFRGIRLNGKAIEAALENCDVMSNVNALPQRGLTLDLQVGPPALSVLQRLSAQAPALRIVVNHAATAPDAQGLLNPDWLAFLRGIAELPNVFCKLSGFDMAARQRDDAVPEEPSVYRPVFDAMLDSLGSARLLFASNWPVCERDMAYAAVFAIVNAWAARLSEGERRRIWADNAHRAYGPLRETAHTTASNTNTERPA